MVAESLSQWMGGSLLAVGLASLTYSVTIQTREGGSGLSILASTDSLATTIAGSLLLNAQPCSDVETAVFLVPWAHTFASNMVIAWEANLEAKGKDPSLSRLGTTLMSLIFVTILPWISTLSQGRQGRDLSCSYGGALSLYSDYCLNMDPDSVEEQQESVIRNVYEIVNEFQKIHKARFLSDTRDMIEPQYTLDDELPRNLTGINILHLIGNSTDLKPNDLCGLCYLPSWFVARLILSLFIICYLLPVVISLFMTVKGPNRNCVLTLILSSAFLWFPQLIQAIVQAWVCMNRPSQTVESITFLLSQGQYIVRAFIHQRILKACSKNEKNRVFGPLFPRKLADKPQREQIPQPSTALAIDNSEGISSKP